MGDTGGVTRRGALLVSTLFAFFGPGLEIGVGPWLITGGWESGGPSPPSRLAGIALLAAGLAVVAWCFACFVRDGVGSPSPLAPPLHLVARGPYRWVRHPMYLATAAAIIGQGLLLGRPVLLACALLYLVALGLQVRWLEDPRLRARFGAEYDAYRTAVPGWIPKRVR